MYAKHLPIELVEVPAPNPEEYRALNPIGKVPALDLGDGNIIPESQVICEFLEARFPEPPLLPKDPETRARAAVLSRLADLYVLPLFDPLADQLDPSTRNETALNDLVNELFNRLDQLEILLRGAPFAVGEELSLADCTLVPAFFFITRFAPPLGRDPFDGRPKLDAWWRAIQRHPAVSRVLDEMTKELATLLETGVPLRINPEHGESSGAEGQGEQDGFLSKYVCQKLVSRMLEAARSGTFGGERLFATVMFIDIHGFTTLAERFDPEQVMEILNRNLELIIQTIFRHDGAVLQLLGDGALVVFGVHKKRDDDVQRAASSALDIHASLRMLQSVVPEAERVAVAIGIDCGEVVCGSIGDRERLEFALVGDAVNVAARVQGLARSGETLLTANVAQLIEHDFLIEHLEDTMVKGRASPVRLFKLTGSQSEHGV